MVSDTGGNYKKVLNAFKNYLHKTSKVILMTATPIVDSPHELGLLINLLGGIVGLVLGVFICYLQIWYGFVPIQDSIIESQPMEVEGHERKRHPIGGKGPRTRSSGKKISQGGERELQPQEGPSGGLGRCVDVQRTLQKGG